LAGSFNFHPCILLPVPDWFFFPGRVSVFVCSPVSFEWSNGSFPPVLADHLLSSVTLCVFCLVDPFECLRSSDGLNLQTFGFFFLVLVTPYVTPSFGGEGLLLAFVRFHLSRCLVFFFGLTFWPCGLIFLERLDIISLRGPQPFVLESYCSSRCGRRPSRWIYFVGREFSGYGRDEGYPFLCSGPFFFY